MFSQPPTISLTVVNEKILFFGILCQNSFRCQFLGFILLLSVSFLNRINQDNRIFLVSCVDLLKTKFTISFSELQEDHRFFLLDKYLFFFNSNFPLLPHFLTSQQLLLSAKSPIILPPDLRLNFLLKETAYQNH